MFIIAAILLLILWCLGIALGIAKATINILAMIAGVLFVIGFMKSLMDHD